MDNPTAPQDHEEARSKLGEELYKLLPSHAIDWMPSNWCLFFAEEIIKRSSAAHQAGFREGVEKAAKMVADLDPLMAPDPSEWEESESIAASVQKFILKNVRSLLRPEEGEMEDSNA